MFNKSEEIRRRHWTRTSDEHKRNEIINKFRMARMLQKFPIEDTSIEIIMQKELTRRHIDFVAHQPVLNMCQPDMVIINERLIVQCDGDWWHANPRFYDYGNLSKIQAENIKRDTYQDAMLRRNGWRVMRFWGSEIKKDIRSCVDIVETFLSTHRSVNSIIQRGNCVTEGKASNRRPLDEKSFYCKCEYQ